MDTLKLFLLCFHGIVPREVEAGESPSLEVPKPSWTGFEGVTGWDLRSLPTQPNLGFYEHTKLEEQIRPHPSYP